MDKLDEREPATRTPLAAAPALAVQFFLIPLTVVAVTVAVRPPYMQGLRLITKTSKRQMDEVVRARTSSRNYNVLLANKIYTSDMTLNNIATQKRGDVDRPHG